jgi:hypothetical protein
MRARSAIGSLLAFVGIVGILLIQPGAGSSSRTEVVAEQTNWTYQLRPGQLFRLKGVQSRRVTEVPNLLTPVAPVSPGAGKDPDATYRATGYGVGMVRATFPCGCQWGQITRSFGVIVSTRAFDVPLTSLDMTRTFLLTVGEEAVFGYVGTKVTSSDPSVSRSPHTAELADGLTAFHAVSPGRSVLSFQGYFSCSNVDTCEETPPQPLAITLLVSGSSDRFDRTATELDAGRTLHVRQGQTLEFVMHQDAGLDPWGLSRVDYQDRLLPVIDPSQHGDPHVPRFPFVASALGTTYLTFSAAPAGCWPAEECPRLAAEIKVTVVIEP